MYFSKHHNIALLALDFIYEKDDALREYARTHFGFEHEVLSLLNIRHGTEDFMFIKEYITSSQ